MNSMSILGSGSMARGIGARAVAAGWDLQILDRDPDRAAVLVEELGAGESAVLGDALTGELVVLAVPYDAAVEIVSQYAGALQDKIVVDVTNPVDPAAPAAVLLPPGTSAAQEIATAAMGRARVVKAFNTVLAAPLAAGQVDGEVPDVLLAGDDDDAKAAVAAFAEAAGLRPLDVGALSMARSLEETGLVGMALAARSGNWGRMLKLLG